MKFNNDNKRYKIIHIRGIKLLLICLATNCDSIPSNIGDELYDLQNHHTPSIQFYRQFIGKPLCAETYESIMSYLCL